MTVKRVGIVGSGIMGSGIAEVAAKAGFEVSLRSRQQNTADRMMAGLEKSLGKQVDKGKLDAGERDTVLGRVRAVTDLGELAECDLVIESIIEDLAVKKHLFNELDRVCHESAVLDRLSDEHGMIIVGAARNPFSVGDRVLIIPNSHTVVFNQFAEVHGVRDGKVEEVLPVAARAMMR